MPPNNGSRHGSGAYASPEQSRLYRERMEAYLDRRNAEWLDRWTNPHTGEVRRGIKELGNVFQCDNHLVNWAIRHGLLDPRSIKPDGLQHRQIGRLTGLIYFRDERHHRALALELAAYLDGKQREQIDRLREGPGRWVVVPRDCVHDWEWLDTGGHRCRGCGGEWQPTEE